MFTFWPSTKVTAPHTYTVYIKPRWCKHYARILSIRDAAKVTETKSRRILEVNTFRGRKRPKTVVQARLPAGTTLNIWSEILKEGLDQGFSHYGTDFH